MAGLANKITTTQEARPTNDTVAQPLQAVVVDTCTSPYGKLCLVLLTAVTLRATFWEPRRLINRRVTLPNQYEHCERTGRLDNVRRTSGKKHVLFQGIFFNDSDVYKWLDGVAWTLATVDDPHLAQLADRVIDEIADAQQPDGYLNTYFMFDKATERWTNFDLHELYCTAHVFQAAVYTISCRQYHHADGNSLLCVGQPCAGANAGVAPINDVSGGAIAGQNGIFVPFPCVS
jgi:hypothetical protein